MYCLAIESATEAAGVALADADGVAASVEVGRGRRHVETIAPAIAFVCERAGVRLAEVDVIACDVGPGLFTGLRVGIGAAKALAFALDRPVVTATSLEILAAAAAAGGAPPGASVVAVVAARRGECFSARFTVSGAADLGATQDEEDRLDAPEALAARLRPGDLVVGDGARRYAEVLGEGAGARVAGPTSPPVATLALVALERARAGATAAAAQVAPRYLRPADARINWEQRRPARPAGGAGAPAGAARRGGLV